jgi:hypothetical protein
VNRALPALVAACAGVLAAPALPAVAAAPRLIPPTAHPTGAASYASLSARYWEWVADNPAHDASGALVHPWPVPDNPDGTAVVVDCAYAQTGRTWFLPAVPSGFGPGVATANRSCTVPSTKQLFIPIVSGFHAGSIRPVDRQQAVLARFVDRQKHLSLVVDGVTLLQFASGQAADAGAFRVAAPVFALQVPADNVFGAPAGTYAPATADGVYAELAPLDPGEHLVQWVVSPDRPRSNSTTQSTTYRLTVVP